MSAHTVRARSSAKRSQRSTAGASPVGASRPASIWLGLALGALSIVLLRQPWAKSQFWPWVLLLFAMFFVAWYLRAAQPAGRETVARRGVKPEVSGRRRLGGIALVVTSLILTASLVITLWPDFHRWQGTPGIWCLAMALLLLGAWLLNGLGHAAPRANTAPSQLPHSTSRRWLELGAFVLIFALAVFLRLWRIDQIPSGIYVDETNAGLDALYLLEGRDVSPFATGWYGTPNGYIYYMAFIIKLLGANWMALKWISLLPAILTVPAVFLLARSLFGPVTGLAAMLLMAVSRWHLSMSRWGWNETAPPLFQVLGMYFLVRGLRGRRALDYALSGLLMGLSLYTYLGARLAILTWGLYIIYWFVSDPDGIRRSVRRSWHGILILAAAALIAAAPILVTYVSDPFSYGNRVEEISILRDIRDKGSLEPLRRNLADMLKFFHQTGDLQGKHNLPGEPMMDPFTGLFFAIGAAYALLRLRDHRRVMLLLWLVIGLAGSFLSSNHESPQAYRSLTALPAGILMAADALVMSAAAVQQAASRRPAPHKRWQLPASLAAAIVALVLLGAAIWESYVYFGPQARSIAVIRGFNHTENGVTRDTITALQSGRSVFMSPGFGQFSPLRFLVYGLYKARDGSNTLDQRPYSIVLPATGLPLPAESGDALILLESQYWPLREHILSYYPQARIEQAQLSDGSALYVRVAIDAAEIAGLQGLTLSTTFADGRKQSERVTSIQAPTGPSATSAEWDGALRLEHSGRYEFATGTAWQVSLDGRPIIGEQFLGQGLYRIHVLCSSIVDAAERPLLWRLDGGEWAPIPSSVMFDIPGTADGLLATYWTNTSWEGQPLFSQVTPFVLLSWTEGMLPANAFSARLEGTLRITEPGLYQFQVEADDGARLLVDGSILGESLVPNRPNRFDASVSLEPGDHLLQLDYVQYGGGSGLRLMWSYANRPFEPVPPSALIPALP